jgi:hypothetical protein
MTFPPFPTILRLGQHSGGAAVKDESDRHVASLSVRLPATSRCGNPQTNKAKHAANAETSWTSEETQEAIDMRYSG